MSFKLTYSDGQETDYDDSTKWEVEDGVVKMGREAGKWTVFVSPSHWATLELVSGNDRDKQHKDQHKGKHEEDEDGDSDKAKDKQGKGKGKDKDG
jgi:hypothetical protein